MNTEEVIKDIQNCPNVEEIYKGGSNACAGIVNFQKNKNVGLDDFKGPEAWNGQLDKSKILVISSNPSIGDEEIIPTKKWEIEDTIDFYQNRSSSSKEWVRNNGGKQADGTYSGSIANWSETKNRMKYIFGNEVEIGIDYTLMELVHCKSVGEAGVRGAINECTNKYFEKAMKVSPAKVLIITGAVAIDFFRKKYNITKKTENESFGLCGQFAVGGIDRKIIFLPHTNFHGRRKAIYFISEIDKKEINKFLE